MNHEPECRVAQYSDPCMFLVPEYLCDCDRISAAYQRGREDAAKTVEAVFMERVAAFEKSPLQERDEAFAIGGLEEAIAIVRGDGEEK